MIRWQKGAIRYGPGSGMQRATDSELRDDGIIVHRRGKKVVGLTIQDASTR